MRDQASRAVDDVDDAFAPEMDARDHIPDVLQADFGDRHAGRGIAAGNRECDEGFAAFAEIDVAVIDAIRPCARKCGRGRAICQRVHPAQFQSRFRDPFASGFVEQHQVGDRRCLAHGAQHVQPPLLGRVFAPWQGRQPGQLQFHLAQKLENPYRRGVRLGILQGGDGLALLLVSKTGADDCGYEQRHRHDQHEDRRIAALQRPAQCLPAWMHGADRVSRCAGRREAARQAAAPCRWFGPCGN